MAINTWLGNYEHVIQALIVIVGLIALVDQLLLLLAGYKKNKIKGELYFATIDCKTSKMRRAKNEEVKSVEKRTFLTAEIQNTGDTDIILRNNDFKIVSTFLKISVIPVVTLKLFKSKDRSSLLIPKRKKVDFDTFSRYEGLGGTKKQSALYDVKKLYGTEPINIKDANTLASKLRSFSVIFDDELGKEFKLKINKEVINELKKIVADNLAVDSNE